MSKQTELTDTAQVQAPQAAQIPVVKAEVVPYRMAVQDARKAFEAIMDTSEQKLSFMREAAFAIDILSKNDYLAKLDPKSIQDSVVGVAKLGLTLSPSSKLCYLIPRGGKCTLDISYMGMIHLLVASGAVKNVTAELVHENDYLDYEPSALRVVHKVTKFTKSERGEIIGAYAVYTMPDNRVYIPRVMFIDELNAIKQRSESVKAGRQSPWTTDEGEMFKKTVIRNTFKLIPRVVYSEAWQQRFEYAEETLNADFKDITQPAQRDLNDLLSVE